MLKNILISKLFGIDPLDVALNRFSLNKTQSELLKTKLELLNTGVPLDYLVGKVNILGLELIVNEHTLIPREETEFWLKHYKSLASIKNINMEYNSPREMTGTAGLDPATHSLKGWQSQTDGVDKSDATDNVNKQNSPYHEGSGGLNDTAEIGDTVVAVTNSQTLIDLGTGTGIIGLYLSDIYDKVYLLDVDEKTLAVTKQNIELNQKTNCQAILSDGLLNSEKIIVKNEKWGLIGNLPYLPAQDIIKAKEYKVEHEPALALYSGDDGLELFNKVLIQIGEVENKPVNVLFELDPRNIRQAQINLNRLNYETEIWLDQNGLERVLVGVLKELK